MAAGFQPSQLGVGVGSKALTDMATGIGPHGWTLVFSTSQLVWAWIALALDALREVAPQQPSAGLLATLGPGREDLRRHDNPNTPNPMAHHDP